MGLVADVIEHSMEKSVGALCEDILRHCQASSDRRQVMESCDGLLKKLKGRSTSRLDKLERHMTDCLLVPSALGSDRAEAASAGTELRQDLEEAKAALGKEAQRSHQLRLRLQQTV